MTRWQWGLVNMQRWLKRITPDRGTLEKLWCLKPFAALGVDRGCWTFKRTSVVRAFAWACRLRSFHPLRCPCISPCAPYLESFSG